MKKIFLYGELEQFGKEFELDVQSPAEAIRALSFQLKGFEQKLRDSSFHILRGEDLEITEKELSLGFGSTQELHIIPEAVGAKRGGLGKAILGIAIIGAAVLTSGASLSATAFTAFGTEISFGQIALYGVSMALSGIGQLLSPVPKVSDYSGRESPEERPSFLFTGPTNTIEQGQPVPVVYGKLRVGSVVISAGLTAEQI